MTYDELALADYGYSYFFAELCDYLNIITDFKKIFKAKITKT